MEQLIKERRHYCRKALKWFEKLLYLVLHVSHNLWETKLLSNFLLLVIPILQIVSPQWWCFDKSNNNILMFSQQDGRLLMCVMSFPILMITRKKFTVRLINTSIINGSLPLKQYYFLSFELLSQYFINACETCH